MTEKFGDLKIEDFKENPEECLNKVIEIIPVFVM
jgi:hypothetical protein